MLAIKKEEIEKLKTELGKKFPVFDARNDNLPAKQYFLPGKEEVFFYDIKKKKAATPSAPKPFVIFGLNLRDTEALAQLDEIMRKPPLRRRSEARNEDFFYLQKRNAATIISVIEGGGALPHIGVDLILEKLDHKNYKAHALTEKGKKITKSKLFKKSPTYDTDIVSQKPKMPELRELLKDPELLKDAVEWSWQNYPEKWEELGARCIGCGICTYVCPLCYCFSNEDRCLLDEKICIKKRNWTACTLPEFAKITGGPPAGEAGHDFHPTLKERYYNWFFHKFVRAYKEYGKSQCVACGRCKEQCPAKIDIEKELIDIVKKYKSSQKYE